MPKSSHEVPVIRVKLEEHPNADKLALVRIDEMRVVGVRKDEWKDGDLGAFIQADMVVPDNEAFKWIGSDRRVRPRKFRGVMSWGVLVPAPPGAVEGDDAGEALGVTRYSPPEPVLGTGGDSEKPPRNYAPIYDLESYYKYSKLLTHGEPVAVTEKIHGTNARFTYWDDQMHVGSHRDWKRQSDKSLYWKALSKYPGIELYCRTHPGHVVYGEIFGDGVQDLTYGAAKGEIYFRTFDIRYETDSGTRWVPYADLFCCCGMPAVPLLYLGPYSDEVIRRYIDGKSSAGDHVREGIVVAPLHERYDTEIGRVKLKAVSMDYLERRK